MEIFTIPQTMRLFSTKIDMNILIPMAGRGERFVGQGYTIPKPLVEIFDKSMIQLAIESLDISGQFIFIVYKYSSTELNAKLRNIINSCTLNPIIIEIDYITDGPASSALLAEKFIDNDDELIITNCDQIMTWNSSKFLKYINKNKMIDGIVVTYTSDTEKNSYIKVDEKGRGLLLAEKEVISELSLNGIHYWRKGRYFVDSAKSMIKKNIRCKNEFYVSLTYNEMIDNGLLVSNYHIKNSEHNAVGVPHDLEKYLKENGNYKN